MPEHGRDWFGRPQPSRLARPGTFFSWLPRDDAAAQLQASQAPIAESSGESD
jgi:hypothetical protein